MTITPQPSFYGDYKKSEEPTDWIWKYELFFPSTSTDSEKINWFELQCAAASPAESWFATLPASDKTSWTTFLAVFKLHWPPLAQVVLTVAQKKDQIKALVLKEDEIGIMIEEDRGREWGHVKWAKKVARMAQGFNNMQCHLLDIVLENTPEVLHDFLLDNYTTWMEFKTDVTKVSALQLLRAKQQLVMEQKLHEDVDKLQSQTTNSHKAMPSTMQVPYTAPPAYRYRQHYGGTSAVAPQLQATTSLPTSQTPSFPTLPQTPQTPQAANMFASVAPATRGNLFYGYRGYPQTPTRHGGSPAEHLRTAAQYTTIPHHPNSEAGRQAYTQQIQDWHMQHGSDAIPNSQRPYPLKPGMSPIRSRECFSCGMAMMPSHQAYDCPNEALPSQETKWTLASTATLGPTANVQFMAPIMSTLPVQYPMPPPQAAYFQHPYFTEPKRVWTAVGGDLPVVPDLNDLALPAPTEIIGADMEDNPPTLDLPDVTCSIPLSETTSAFTSHFSTSALNTPISQMQDVLNDEESVDEFIVPTIKITSPGIQQELVSAMTQETDSFFEDLLFSDLDFSFLSMPNSSSSTSSHVELHNSMPDSHVQSPWIIVPNPVEHNLNQ
ncbi:hypothetical protein BDR06DRAFT_968530 [Suillus hirtellus]|nr:hypothetical protein BDR06DRAFT_968530 [Suillus hirtellus]